MISVIIPTYNSEKTIKQCLEALHHQTAKNYEVIVVDDGSKDNTLSIVKLFTNVKFFKRAHKGPASARNFGAKMARGDILLFTDSDCEPDIKWVEEMAAPFSNRSVVGVSGTYRTRQKEIVARFAQYEIEERHLKMAKEVSIDFIGTFSAGYRKEIFEKFKGFDESFSTSAGEDPELSFRIAEQGLKMVFAPKAFVYHKHPSNILSYLRQKYRNAYWRYIVYRKREKTFAKGHSYTPKSAFWEIALAGLLFFSILGLIIRWKIIFKTNLPLISDSIYVIFLMVLIISCSLPLLRYIFKRDILVGFWSPLIIIARAFLMGVGVFLAWIDYKFRRRFK